MNYITYMIIIKYFYYASLGVNYQLNPPHIWMGGGGGGESVNYSTRYLSTLRGYIIKTIGA